MWGKPSPQSTRYCTVTLPVEAVPEMACFPRAANLWLVGALLEETMCIIFPLYWRSRSFMVIISPRKYSDRKSTRLNSSHQIISYAVFCLKKKKKDTQQIN